MWCFKNYALWIFPQKPGIKAHPSQSRLPHQQRHLDKTKVWKARCEIGNWVKDSLVLFLWLFKNQCSLCIRHFQSRFNYMRSCMTLLLYCRPQYQNSFFSYLFLLQTLCVCLANIAKYVCLLIPSQLRPSTYSCTVT